VGKQADIVRAAQELFAEVGFAKTGIREIANRAHVAIATIYAHFGSGKVGVLQAAIDERIARLGDYVAATAGEDPVEAFLQRVRRLNTEVIRDPFLCRLASEQDRIAEDGGGPGAACGRRGWRSARTPLPSCRSCEPRQPATT
jgi:AcrR family transcriptional regulator